MSSKAKIFCLVNENAVELDLLVYWDSSDGIAGWTVRMTEIFPDESLDFVYIDANHAYDFVKC